jgi:hypothetical protein
MIISREQFYKKEHGIIRNFGENEKQKIVP